MVLLDNDQFLAELTKLFQKSRTSGSVYTTMKQYYGQNKPKPKAAKGERLSVSDQSEHKCLFRATNGKKKISTVISTKDVTKFQMAYANVMKGNMDGLKKRDKRSAKSKSKTTKAT
ncbi:signal recognition particle 14 kDa protein [Strongylocentrotus purpuratus]|uniref:Signal recognition particle 14 kDa protein n=1 Tax=Strongylocentrotus purpuratus TaxID=7668 RepID=A0A7M7PRF2_STRPU|nr:signal recognition particle 14 kDa protein [Strongylocentrotus purpuratus]